MSVGVKKRAAARRVRTRGYTHVSSKNQATIPVDVLREAGIVAGDRLRARADGAGRVILERTGGPTDDYSGLLRGVSSGAFLDRLRDEWALR